MGIFSRDEVDAIVMEASQFCYDGYIGYHLSRLRRHLEKADTLKRHASKQEHWAKVEEEAHLLQKWIPNLKNPPRSIDDGHVA